MENHADLLVIFGITGDLARRMTFRALYRRLATRIGRAERPLYYLEVPRPCSAPSWSTSARPGCCARAGSRSRSRSATTWPRPAS